MVAAWEYTPGDVFLSMLWFFLFVIWIWLLISVFGDIFRSPDLSGWSKALWTIFVVVAPYLGVFVYLIARGKKMGMHAADEAMRREQEMRAYVQSVAAPTSTAEEIQRFSDLHQAGVITEAEFQQAKGRLLATSR